MTIALRRGAIGDIPFVMACERRPGYDAFVGRWEDAQHRTTIEDPDWIYLIGSRNGVDGGFSILSGLAHPNKNLLLKRIAVHEAENGFGKAFLSAVTDWVFTETKSERFWLEVVDANERARHVYRSLGWVEEGEVRGAFDRPDGSGRGSFFQMSILKPEWQARLDARRSAP